MRKYSQGSVQKYRGEWRAVLSYQEDGVQHRITRGTGVKCYPKKDDNRGKQTAERILRDWRDEVILEAASNADTVTSNDPFIEFCKRYARSRYRIVKDSTFRGYITEIRRLTGTELGKTPICNVEQEAILKHESDLIANGLSTTSAVHHHAFMAAVFKAAAANRKISYNPMATMKSPKARSKPINSLTIEGRARVLELLRDRIPDEFSVAVIIALMTGMRRGEICALRWTDIDAENRIISVNHNLAQTINGGYELSSPKDPGRRDSIRTIPFGERLAYVLAKRKTAMAQTRALLDFKWDPGLYVVGNALTKKPYSPDLLSRDWRCFAKSNGLYGTQATYPVFHDLRHTFATLAIKEKVIDIKALSEILGHKDAAMTLNVYADALEDAKRSGMERLDMLMP